MTDERVAERWLDLLRQEEAHLTRLIEILSADQTAVSESRCDLLEENLPLKEAAIAGMEAVARGRRTLADSAGVRAEGEDALAERLAPLLPASRRAEAADALARVRVLRSDLAGINDLNRRIMVHGLFLVRSTLALICGEPAQGGYGEKGGASVRPATGRIVRQNV